MSLLEVLIGIVERAGLLAKGIRSNPDLLKKLTEEKSSADKNVRFTHDFKTLADVLIQELARYEISLKFPELTNRINGEESSHITISEGRTVDICVSSDKSQTVQCLTAVLYGDEAAAEALAELIYGNHGNDSRVKNVGWDESCQCDVSDMAVWIDPIDGTNVYVQAEAAASVKSEAVSGIVKRGLENVTVLIGAFSLTTGLPVCGVMGQPFASFDAGFNAWTSLMFWGIVPSITGQGRMLSPNISQPQEESPCKKVTTVLMSSSEPLANQLQVNACLKIEHASGAGYKILCVILGHADVYLCSKPTTFWYDTCAPHAILNAMNSRGGVVDFQQVVNIKESVLDDKLGDVGRGRLIQSCVVRYGMKGQGKSYCNEGGILCFKNERALIAVLKAL